MSEAAASSAKPAAPEDKEFKPTDTERDDEATLEEEEAQDQGDVKVS